MPSRMSRYHGNTRASSSRCERNEELCKNLYQTSNYSNISAVATLEKTNEIEIEKIRKMIKDRETYKKQKEVASIYKKETEKENKVSIPTDFEEKNYDIRDVLTKAKEERKSAQDESYKKNQYEYLLNTKTYTGKKEIQNDEEISQELKEIINTITNNADLNKLSNSELSLDLLNDLKSNTIHNGEIENDSIRKIIEEEKRREEKMKAEANVEMDKSFYTTNLNFSDKDFELDDNIIQEAKKGNLIIKFILGIILLLITIITIYVVYINIKSI